MHERTIVITGSSRGIGFALADELVRRGQRVVVSGSSSASTERAAAQLVARHGKERILAQPCDVRVATEVQALWDASAARFGQVDLWINNAGLTSLFAPIWDVSSDDIDAVCAVDIAGLLHGCRVAIRGMRAQGSGMIYNLEGLGSGGEKQVGLTVYGTAKCAVRYASEALARELSGTPVRIGTISPGMVTTDLLLGQKDRMSAASWERTKRAINIFGDGVQTVVPFIATKLLAGGPNGHRICWLTRTRAIARLLTASLRPRTLV